MSAHVEETYYYCIEFKPVAGHVYGPVKAEMTRGRAEAANVRLKRLRCKGQWLRESEIPTKGPQTRPYVVTR